MVCIGHAVVFLNWRERNEKKFSIFREVVNRFGFERWGEKVVPF